MFDTHLRSDGFALAMEIQEGVVMWAVESTGRDGKKM